jgi:hypothetical protein
MYHGGILSPQTGQLRPDVTTLAVLDHHEARRGYPVGREGYFHEAQPQEQRYSEALVIERLSELVIGNPYSEKDNVSTWYYCLSCLLGELSGPLFSETAQERAAWEEACRYWAARKAQEEARAIERRTVLQEA